MNNDYSIEEILGINLKKFRRAKGWTQKELADHAKLNMNYVSDAERGTRNISIKNLGKLVKALKVSPKELLSLDSNSNERITMNAPSIKTKTNTKPKINSEVLKNKVLSQDMWNKSVLSKNTNKSDEEYMQYLDKSIEDRKLRIITQAKNRQNPKDLEYSFEDNLDEAKDCGEYYDILNKVGFATNNNPNSFKYKNLDYAYFDWDKHIEDKIDDYFKEAYQQSKAEYKSATLDKSIKMPEEDNDPSD